MLGTVLKSRFLQLHSNPLKTILKIILSAAACFATTSSWAEDKRDDPIDIQYQHDVDKDMSTAGIRTAANKAREKWDKEMNVVYGHLMTLLDKEQQEKMRESQRAWLKYRDANGEVLAGVVAVQQGTMWQLTATVQQMETVRARVLELRMFEFAASGG